MTVLKTMDEGKDLDMPISAALRANGSSLQKRRPVGTRWGRGESGRRRQHPKTDLNLHAYVGADPVNFTDPLGLAPGDCANGVCEPFSVGAGALRGSAARFAPGISGRFQLDMPIEGGSGGGGGGVDTPHFASAETQPRCLVPPPAIQPSAATTSRAANQALREIYGQKPGPMTSPLSREFATLNAIPDFSQGGWSPTTSVHSGYAWEAPIGSRPGYVVKVYINDRDLGGRNTVAITSSTYTPGHAVEALINRTTGYVGNADRAVQYLESKRPCK